tara:strand:+ start:46316 stop:47443 length:1128 start_codon:yes stop_codon:yes gene_type:complete
MKVITILGTRPEIIRLSRVIPKLDECFEHVLVHTGQNFDYELNEIFFKDLKIRKPDFFLNSANKNSSPSEVIGKIISLSDSLFQKLKPDALLILGDTNSCLSAIAAKKRGIPIFHMEAGNRCFDQRVPEEINRKIIDHVSDINLPYSSIARQYLISEGFPPDQIIKTGSPMIEVINYYSKGIKSSNILKKLKLIKNKYFVVSSHREENIDSDKNLKKLIAILNSLAEDYKFPIIFSTHPRTQIRIDSIKNNINKKIKFIKPLGFKDYLNLQINAKATLSDSGTISEEASILNLPALNIREAHERPEGMEETSAIMTGLELDKVHEALKIISTNKNTTKRNFNLVKDYSDDNVSEKIPRIIVSYTDYVKRVVYKNY